MTQSGHRLLSGTECVFAPKCTSRLLLVVEEWHRNVDTRDDGRAREPAFGRPAMGARRPKRTRKQNLDRRAIMNYVGKVFVAVLIGLSVAAFP
jgi:hypothetical protein